MYRYLVTKNFDGGNVATSRLTENWNPFLVNNESYTSRNLANRGYKKVIDNAKEYISAEMLSKIWVEDESKPETLQKVYDKVTEMDEKELRYLTEEMFHNINPNTGEADMTGREVEAKNIALAVLTETFPPQQDAKGVWHFNPEGVVSLGEVLDFISAVDSGSNTKKGRNQSIDNVSTESDYFNVGYNMCVDSYSSPLYNLYNRADLLEPITQSELAYVIVFCLDKYRKKYGTAYEGRRLGIKSDWENLQVYLDKYEDMSRYKVYSNKGDDKWNISIKPYIKENISTLRSQMREGVVDIPLPYVLALVELNENNEVKQKKRLNPSHEVSRSDLMSLIPLIVELNKE